MADKDYYDILGLSRDASKDQVKAAYRDLAFKYHPDRNTDNPGAAAKMQEVNEAYAVLSDEKKRQDYDSMRQRFGSADAYSHFRKNYSEQDIFKGTDIQAVFNELARSFGFRDFNALSKEFFAGRGNTFEFKRPGMRMGGMFFFGHISFGKQGLKQALPGILGKIIQALPVKLSDHQLASEDSDLHDTIRISPDLAQSGGPYAYYHPWQSKKLVVQIPPHVQHGQRIRLAGMGQCEYEGAPTGDLYLTIETHRSLADRIRKYLPF